MGLRDRMMGKGMRGDGFVVLLSTLWKVYVYDSVDSFHYL